MVIFLLTSVLSVLFFLSTAAYAKSFGAKMCDKSHLYSCYVVKKGDTWKNLFADAAERDLVMRINRMNTKLHPGLKIAIPASTDRDPLTYSPLAKYIGPPGKNIIIVSMHDLAFGAYDASGTLIHWGPISGGKSYCADVRRSCQTAIGKFAIYRKAGQGCVSGKFPLGRGGAPMPYCMFFHGGFALHGSYEVPGYHASHGCVRMFVNDAKWLNQEFTAQQSKTPVIVYK